MRRPLSLLVVAGVIAAGVVGVSGSHPAYAVPAGDCRFDPASATLVVNAVTDRDEVANVVRVGRTAQGAFSVSGDGFPASGTDCGGARVDNVDTVQVRVERAVGATTGEFEQGGGFDKVTIDRLTIVVDQSNGAFEPGAPPVADETGRRDLFRPGAQEDDHPEIELDLHLPHPGRATLSPHVTLAVAGTPGDDHVVAASKACPDPEDPTCRATIVNLNAGADEDPDVFVTAGEVGEGQSPLSNLSVEGGPGNDVLSLRGGPDFGAPVDLAAFLSGGEGDDVLLAAGGADTLEGGPGHDRLEGGAGGDELLGGGGDDTLDGGEGDDDLFGGPGHDRLLGGPGADDLFGDEGDDTLAGGFEDDVVDGGPGDDALDEGFDTNGADALIGGDGNDSLDYSKRSFEVSATRDDDEPNDGEPSEGDDVAADVETVHLPAVAADATLRVVGQMSAPVACNGSGPEGNGGRQGVGPCPLLVDTVNGLGLSYGSERRTGTAEQQATQGLYVFDLRGPELGKRVGFGSSNDCPTVGAHEEVGDGDASLSYTDPMACLGVPTGALDPSRRILWATSEFSRTSGPGVASARCGLSRWDYRDLDTIVPEFVRYDCTTTPPVQVLSVSRSDGDPDALYVSGSPRHEGGARRAGSSVPSAKMGFTEFGVENLGQPLIVRRLKVTETGRALRKDVEADVDVDVDVDFGLDFDWDLDLRAAGCGRRVNPNANIDPQVRPLLTRVGDQLVAYCWDARPYLSSPFFVGEQGYIVRIPLDPATDEPLPLVGGTPLAPDPVTGAFINYRSVRTPTLPGFVDATVDEAAGTVLLITDGPLNGNAVWMFDLARDRFVGVVSGGATRQPIGNTAAGVDSVRGRSYLLTQDGVLVVPTRARPLPPGVVYPVAQNRDGRTTFVNYPTIAVDPESRRLFVPVNFPDQKEAGTSLTSSDKGARYLVLQDDVAEPPPPPPADPDVNTVQRDEAPGVTEVSTRAAGQASGAHVVVTGGVVRAVDQSDPTCRTEANFPIGPNQNYVTVEVASGRFHHRTVNDDFHSESTREQEWFPVFGDGECAGGQLVTPGHREFWLGQSSAEAGSGSVASGSGLAFANTDATHADVRRKGSCEQGLVVSQFRGQAPPQLSEGYAEACDSIWDGATARSSDRDPETGEPTGTRDDDPDAHPADPRRNVPDSREGTRGRDGRGFPVPSASCGDFGGGAQRPDPVVHPLASAEVSCDHASSAASATAEAKALSLVADGTPLLAVARTASSLTSFRHPERGQVTVAAASAEGVVIGPLAVREVRAVAVTAAKGRTGTASADIERRWCGLSVAGDGVADAFYAGLPEEVRGQVRAELEAALVAAGGCIDPAHPKNARLVESLNRALQGKVRLAVAPVNGDGEGEATPGGYQAVVTKDPVARGGDRVVNDDDSHTVSALEATVYNDGSLGRNRVIVQLAGVHAESRYGVTLLPQFAGFDGSFSTGSFDGTPSSRRVVPGTRRLPSASTIIEGEGFEELFSTSPLPEDPIRRFLGFLPDALKDLWRLFVQHPLEFLLLFFVFSLLGTPAYLAYRRRTFVGVVAG